MVAGLPGDLRIVNLSVRANLVDLGKAFASNESGSKSLNGLATSMQTIRLLRKTWKQDRFQHGPMLLRPPQKVLLVSSILHLNLRSR